ncbi:hypothetical protein ACIQF8_18325 [Pseudarthrobacter sp. NPDC092184]|uniref:hypothetical protein n=1 Tax=Pseudarthrobacter TaxID=1742993 RepID=UPI00168AC6C1|nr:hypothetical protein [Pseudarthrobacter sp. BIM B-2242]QOD01995.1 hypothetical protein IDT60_11335 [Pseudarthrobacter sp. BIM B-2242]BFE45661.1 hypothetical protein GCM10017547_35540 [Pseudarthrobacter oxydans]
MYAAFLVVMVPPGMAAAVGRRTGRSQCQGRDLQWHNTQLIVVLPLVLALPEPLALVSLVVVTQAFVELLGMVAYVMMVPRVIMSDLPLQPSRIPSR